MLSAGEINRNDLGSFWMDLLPLQLPGLQTSPALSHV